MRHPRWIAALAAALLLGACAAPTPYQPNTDSRVGSPNPRVGGYRDERLAPDRYTVTYAGNSRTPSNFVWLMWLYRCAELTEQSGYAYFGILNRASAASGYDMVSLTGFTPPDNSTPRTSYWTIDATILMFRTANEPGAQYGVRTSSVRQQLADFIAHGGTTGIPAHGDVIAKARVSDVRPPAPGRRQAGSGVRIDDLDALLPH